MENGFKTLHVHDDYYFKNFLKPSAKFKIRLLKYPSIFDVINDCNNTIYIIDSYRTSIERKISSFFQNIHTHVPNYLDLSVEDIINIFNEQYLHILDNYHSINEALTHYDVPLFQTFDFQKRYNILRKDNKIFVKILFKDIKKWNIILTEIIGKNIIIHSDNLTENKGVAKLYTEFKSKYKVPKTYIENVLINDEQFKIYNTAEKQEEYLKYWLEKCFS